MREKMWNYFYEIAQQINTRTKRQPNPSSFPISPHLPCHLDKLLNKFGDCMHAEVHLFVLSCQKFNFTTSHATNTSVSLQFGMHFVAAFYISLKSHLLSQYHMLLICSKALKCNEKGIITNKKAIVNQQPTGIQALQHHWKSNIARAILLKLQASLPDRKKCWAWRCSSVTPELLSAITGFSDDKTMPCQHTGEGKTYFYFFLTEKEVICCTGHFMFLKILI